MKKLLIAALAAASLTAPAAAEAYTGPAGCPGYIAPYSTGICAYHTGIRQFSVYASVRHQVWINGSLRGCSPGPCTAWTARIWPPWNGRPTVLNTSPFGLYLYEGRIYG